MRNTTIKCNSCGKRTHYFVRLDTNERVCLDCYEMILEELEHESQSEYSDIGGPKL